MTKKLKLILGLAALCGATLVCAACSSDGSPYKDFDKNDYKVSIRYESNGGNFAGQQNINIVDTYPLSVFENGGVKLLEPGSSDRGGNAQIRSQISRSGYFLAGWYKNRELRFQDEAKTVMLDENGEVTEDSAKQGYTYSEKWNFETDLLTVEKDKEYTSSEVVLTLYAAWVPNYSYEIYMPTADGAGWQLVSETLPQFNPTAQVPNLKVPQWNTDTGAMEYGTFPQASGKTFSKIYADKEMQTEITEGVLPHNGSWDTDKAVAFNAVERYYTTWEDGLWFNITTAQQLYSNARLDGYYNINANITFTKDDNWPAAFAGSFAGKIFGNNHTISNVTVTQTDNTVTYGGLFGRITQGAEIKDITFENVTYIMNGGSRMPNASFGLFAGILDEGAAVENVKISGEIQVGKVYPLRGGGVEYAGYTVGLVTGNGVKTGVSYDAGTITCKSIPDTSGSTPSYPVIVTVNYEEETVTITKNPDSTVDPNAENQD